MKEAIDLDVLILEAAEHHDQHVEGEAHWLTPKGVALLALIREGKTYKEANALVDLAYDRHGYPRKGALA